MIYEVIQSSSINVELSTDLRLGGSTIALEIISIYHLFSETEQNKMHC